jgi:LysR family transcriptional regulator, glycine cleavage system transcriptional activator
MRFTARIDTMRTSFNLVKSMRRATPSTQALLAFAAAARHLSFTKAAHELNLTQGAISRQIAALEDFVRAPLFERLNPGLVLTLAGAAYLPKIEAALRAVESATLELQAFGGQPNHINIACPPSFASIWLMPRLTAFRERFPRVTMNLLPPVWSEPMPSDVDMAIRYGAGSWPNLDAHYLFGRDNVIVCAPAKANRAGKVVAAASRASTRDLAQALQANALLHHAQVPDAWPEALTNLGIEDRVNGYAGPRFAQYTMLLNAAAAGFGIALVPELLARAEAGSGRVDYLLDQRIELSRGYYACFPRERRSGSLEEAVTRWMREEADRDQIDAVTANAQKTSAQQKKR